MKTNLMTDFAENAADFTKKHGMKICAGIFIASNIALFCEPLWRPENYDPLRNTVAAGCQIFANSFHLAGKRDKAYDYSTIGAASHSIASFGQDLYYGACMWGLMAQASYKGSHWPQRIKKISHAVLRGREADKIPDGSSETVPEASRKTPSKQNVFSDFIGNKMGLLKDPHARAGLITFISTTGQFIETLAKDDTMNKPTLPVWTAASWLVAGCFTWRMASLMPRIRNTLHRVH